MANREPRLSKRGNIFHVRVKVPPALRDVIGKTEFTKSLRTSDISEARRLLHIESIKIDAEIARARRKVDGAPIVKLSPSEIEYLTLEWFHSRDRERLRTNGEVVTSDERQRLSDELGHLKQVLSDSDDQDCLVIVREEMRRIFEVHGVRIEPGASEFWQVFELIRRGLIEQTRRSLTDARQDFSVQPSDAFFDRVRGDRPLQPVAAIDLNQLIERFEQDPSRPVLSGKSAIKREVQFRFLREVLGADKPIREITRADTRRVQEILSTLPANATKRFPNLTAEEAAKLGKERDLEPIAPETANPYLSLLSSLMDFAVQEDLISKNPAEGLRIAASGMAAKHKRNPFALTQLRKIFDAPLYRGCLNDGQGYATPGANVIRRGRFWVPLISLFSGMRLNEICQLDLEDIAVEDRTDVSALR